MVGKHREMSGDNVLFLELGGGYTSVCILSIYYSAHLFYIYFSGTIVFHRVNRVYKTKKGFVAENGFQLLLE